MTFKTIVITGASSGIGAALAAHYAAPGISLYLTGRDKDRLDKIVNSCRKKGATTEGKILDVCDEAAMNRFLKSIDDTAPVDLVIANAGISGGTGEGEPESAGQVRQIFNVNVNGVLNTIQPLIPAMIRRGRGHIAIIASLAGYRGFPGAPAYCASKAAVKVYGEALRGSLATTGVGVSVVCPGFVKSRMTAVNEYSMPLLMDTDKAAKIIADGLAKNKGRIAFPLPTAFFVWLFMTLPDGLTQMILRRLPGKSALEDLGRPEE